MSLRSCTTCGRPVEVSDSTVTVRCARCSGTNVDLPATDPGAPQPPRNPVARTRISSVRPPGGDPFHRPGYEVVQELDRFPQGALYLGRQTALNRVVVLTVLDRIEVDDHARRRFRHEAETLARLDHPHLVQLLDVGDSDGYLYAAAEYCPGGSLADQLKRGKLPPAEAVPLVRSLAGGVQAAHDKGIAHGGIRPEVVFWTGDGVAKLAGFGLPRLTGGEPTAAADVAALVGLLRTALADVPPKVEAILQCPPTTARGLADALRGVVAERRRINPLRYVVAAVAVLLLTASFAGLLRLAKRPAWLVEGSAAELWLRGSDGDFGSSPPVRVRPLRERLTTSGATRIEECIVAPAVWQRPGGEGRVQCLLVAGEPEAGSLSPLGQLPAAVLVKLKTPGTVVVCDGDLDRLGLGDDRSSLLGREVVRVIGTIDQPPLAEPAVLCSLATARQVLRLDADQATHLLARGEVAGAQTRDQLSRSLQWRWLTTAPLPRAWAGGAAVTVLLLAFLLLRRRSAGRGPTRDRPAPPAR